jgi:LuxR family maltose regulon positive regulatory protein
MKSLSFAEGMQVGGLFGQTALSGNPYFAASSSVVAFWHHTIYLTTSGQFERALAVSEIMLERLRDVPVLDICFLLASAFCYLSLGDREKAIHYVERGLALALPDRLYTLISDFTVYMDGIDEQLLSKTAPEALRAIKSTNSFIESGQRALRQAYAEKKLPDSLTSREKEVAVLAAQSMRNTDIAEALGISLNTVKMHLKSIYDKLSIDKRSKLREKLKQNS